MPILTRNVISKRRKLNFVNKFKGDFDVKLWNDFKDFERNEKIKRQNDTIETMVCFGILNLFNTLSVAEGLYPCRKNKRF